MEPVREFICVFNMVNEDKALIVLGIVPVSLFDSRESSCSEVKIPIVLGIDPKNRLCDISNILIPVLKQFGIVPPN